MSERLPDSQRQGLPRGSHFGPGFLVTAAFIGPGTVTTASVAGAGFGTALAWAVLFSVVATLVLQEMASRLGVVTRGGLGQALRQTFTSKVSRVMVMVLVVAAVAFGNAAYQMGNLTGAGMGLAVITGWPVSWWAGGVGLIAAVLLWLGAYDVLEKVLIALVGIMSLCFVITAFMLRLDVVELLIGLLRPTLPPGAELTVVALIGTTVVPYNLFLHASAVCEKWPPDVPVTVALRRSRLDTVISIGVGGLITLVILVTAAGSFVVGTKLQSAGQMALQLEPLLGPAAKWFFAVGLGAAGVTSAITAPLAAAYATAGVAGWGPSRTSWRFRAVWLSIIVVGMILAMVGWRPVAAILFAQAANGVLLPVVAVFLLVVVNRSKLLGQYTNRWFANLLGILVVVVAAALGITQILRVLAGLMAT